MPELPEVETMRRGVLPIVGSRILAARPAACQLKPIRIEPQPDTFARRAAGRRIVQIGRVGKRVTMALDNGDFILFEPRMTGLLLLTDPPDREHLRFQLRLEDGPVAEVWYWDRRGLGNVRLMTPAEFERQLGPARLGPDALQSSATDLRDRLGRSRRPIKVALLDQRAIAGIGNLYASEILHVARIHPTRPCDQLSASAWKRLHAALLEVLEEAIRHEGSTLSDGTYRNALNNPGGYQNYHRVYGRAGKTCEDCGVGTVRRIVQAQRSTFFCPRCQRRR